MKRWVEIGTVLFVRLLPAVRHEVGTEAPVDRRAQQDPMSGRTGLRAEDHGIALARDLDLIDGEAEILWQSDGLGVAGLEDLGNMGHGDLSLVG